MEDSINSSNSEPALSNLNSVFKKPTDIHQAFQVSLEESTIHGQSSKCEPDLDASAGTQKTLPFKKSRKSVQHPFSVSLSDSLVNNELEQSVTVVKPPSVFKKQRKSFIDFFNVTFDETNANLQSDVLSKTTDDSNIAFSKPNPFGKCASESESGAFNISSMHVSLDKECESSLESQRHSTCGEINGDEADSTTFGPKQNPFKRANEEKSDSATQLQLSVTNESKSPIINAVEPEIINNTSSSSKLNQEADSSTTKNNSKQFEQRNSLQDCNSEISVTKDSSSKCLENSVSSDPKQSSRKISLNRDISRITNSTTYLEQSSINDENLNNWMSDHSDEELPLPRISSVTTNLSQTKEKPAVPISPAKDGNPLSVWEQKFNEIVSNAEKRSQKGVSKMNLNPPPKCKPLKKPGLSEKNPSEDFNKYKPPKLIKPAPFANKKFYQYIVKRLEPKYGIDKMIESEKLVLSICDTVKKVTRRKAHQKRLIQNLKKEMAEAGLIETTMDFYEFVIKFLPYSFRVKVVPCLQPVTNLVYPPKDVMNPFEKIL